jgi:hypothetical protein
MEKRLDSCENENWERFKDDSDVPIAPAVVDRKIARFELLGFLLTTESTTTTSMLTVSTVVGVVDGSGVGERLGILVGVGDGFPVTVGAAVVVVGECVGRRVGRSVGVPVKRADGLVCALVTVTVASPMLVEAAELNAVASSVLSMSSDQSFALVKPTAASGDTA